MQKYISYLRVSTKRQGLSGLGLSAQQESVSAYLRSVNGKRVAEFVEVESGKRADRPQLAAALAACRLHHAILCVAKLDRLSRNLCFLTNLMESGCEFVCCDNPTANKLTVHILASVAEAEREMISTRTKLALAAAKRKGTVLGGDHGINAAIARKGNRASAAVRSAAAQQRAADLAPIIAEVRSAGAVSLAQIADGLNQRGIPTARGGEWSPVQVMRVMA